MTCTETQINHQDTNRTIMNMAITIETINLRINTQIMEPIIFSLRLIILLSIRIFSIRLQAKKMSSIYKVLMMKIRFCLLTLPITTIALVIHMNLYQLMDFPKRNNSKRKNKKSSSLNLPTTTDHQWPNLKVSSTINKINPKFHTRSKRKTQRPRPQIHPKKDQNQNKNDKVCQYTKCCLTVQNGISMKIPMKTIFQSDKIAFQTI